MDLYNIVSQAANRYGQDPDVMWRVAGIESAHKPAAKNPRSSAGGLFQFIDSTAKQYGLADRYDPYQASDAAARLMRDNASFLRKRLGRDPTGGELYLAHQQGAGGAARLLGNPDANAVSIVGNAAVRLNGGNANMSAGDFANLWIKKMGGAGTGRGGGTAMPQMEQMPGINEAMESLPPSVAAAPGIAATQQSSALQRALLQRLSASAARAPSNVGEGLSALGAALAYRMAAKKADAGVRSAGYQEAFAQQAETDALGQELADLWKQATSGGSQPRGFDNLPLSMGTPL